MTSARNPWTLVGGDKVVNIHDEDRCAGEYCAIHNMSDHHMVEWPQRWVQNKMWRECEHGDLHPDPDARRDPIHVCDGCCIHPVDRLTEADLVDELRRLIDDLRD